MTHPIGRAENMVTHPPSIPAHPPPPVLFDQSLIFFFFSLKRIFVSDVSALLPSTSTSTFN